MVGTAATLALLAGCLLLAQDVPGPAHETAVEPTASTEPAPSSEPTGSAPPAPSSEPGEPAQPLAAGFPTDVPLLTGTIRASSSVGSGTSLRYTLDLQVSDPTTSLRSLEKTFTDAQYTVSQELNVAAYPDGASLVFDSAAHEVTVNLALSDGLLYADYLVALSPQQKAAAAIPNPDVTGVPADFPADVPLTAGVPVKSDDFSPSDRPAWNVRVLLPDNSDPIPAIEDQFSAAGYATEVTASNDGSYFTFNGVSYQLYASDFAGFDNGTYSVMVSVGIDSQKRPYADYTVENTRTPPPPGQLQ